MAFPFLGESHHITHRQYSTAIASAASADQRSDAQHESGTRDDRADSAAHRAGAEGDTGRHAAAPGRPHHHRQQRVQTVNARGAELVGSVQAADRRAVQHRQRAQTGGAGRTLVHGQRQQGDVRALQSVQQRPAAGAGRAVVRE